MRFPFFESLPKNPEKYGGRKITADSTRESESRLLVIKKIQTISNGICLDLGCEQVAVSASGSSSALVASRESDLDVEIRVSQNHPFILDKGLRRNYSEKLLFLIKHAINSQFAINVVFVKK